MKQTRALNWQKGGLMRNTIPVKKKISAMLAKIKNRHETEFQKFKEESEAAYENGVLNCSITIITSILG